MTISKIVALLSVIALLASLPLSVALAQQPPFRVVGTAMIDGAAAMEGIMVVAMVGERRWARARSAMTACSRSTSTARWTPWSCSRS